MKSSHKWLLVLGLLFLIAGLWGWKKRPLQITKTPEVRGELPSSSQAVTLEQTPKPSPQAVRQPVTTGAAPRKFVDMTARESREILRQIKASNAEELLQLFLDAGRIDQDPMKQSSLQGMLTGAIMEGKYSSDFIAKMKRFVMDESNSKLERGLVTSAFAGAHTKEGAEFIMWAVANQTDLELREGAFGNISGLGGDQPYLPSMIEPLWRDSNEAKLLNEVAIAMAREAAPSSIELLLRAAASPDGQDDARRWAAIWALPKVYRKEAVPALVSTLEREPPGSLMSAFALSTISQIGDPSAAQSVMGWLQTADSRAAPLIAGWVGGSSFQVNKKAMESALNPSVPFRSEENREAIRAAISAQ